MVKAARPACAVRPVCRGLDLRSINASATALVKSAILISSLSCRSAEEAIRSRRPSGEVCVLGELGAAVSQGGDDDVDRGQVVRCLLDCGNHTGLESVGAGKEHLALVGQVAEEGPLGQAGALGDLGHGDAVVAVDEDPHVDG